MNSLKKIAMWTGIVLIGMCGIVLLGGGKIMSGTLLITTAFVVVLMVGRHKLPLWARAVLLCAVFSVVIWNISTTDLPNSSGGMVMACASETADTYTSTGFKFLDQLIHISSSFLSQASPS